jgi:hypothetical protein
MIAGRYADKRLAQALLGRAVGHEALAALARLDPPAAILGIEKFDRAIGLCLRNPHVEPLG